MTLGLEGTTALVTGGAGFVGSNLVLALLNAEVASVTVVDNLISSEAWNLPSDPRVSFLEGSASDDGMVGRIRDEYDFIFHLCAYHGNQSSIHDPLADHEHSQLTTLKVFNHVRRYRRLRKLVYSGAGCAVAKKTSATPEPTSEDSSISIDMDSPYSISKLMGEFYAAYYARQHQTPIVRVRFQNVYGPGEVLGAGRWRGTPATVWRNVTPTFIYKALHGEGLPVEGGGEATRDFVFVGDIARGLLAAASRGEPGNVYNLASGVETSIRDLAIHINRLAGNATPLHAVPGRPWDRSGRRVGDPTKTLRSLGFQTEVALEDGLARTISWTRTYLPRIIQCIDRHAAPMAAYARAHQDAAD